MVVNGWVCRCLGNCVGMSCDRMPVVGNVVACDGWMVACGSYVGLVLMGC